MVGKSVEMPSFLTGLRRLFYIVTPQETSFATLKEVPNYTGEATQMFVILILLEFVVNTVRRHKKARVNDAVSSISAGIISQMSPLFFRRSVELTTYIWIYNQYRLVSWPWNQHTTWWVCFIGIDFEINILWAAHQVHHSSEDYNITTALRQSILQRYTSWVFYLPLALVIPPSIYIVHLQLNVLYQFWIHNEIVYKLGPLEYILNTPSHHRVHHGRNPYCIDKNYGGTLIIWDRLFGTFAAEEEEVVYGLTHPINTWNPFTIQACHLQYMWGRFWEEQGITNKLSVVFKGPGWAQGKPRLGDIEDIPKVKAPVDRYDRGLPFWCNLYMLMHFVLIIFGYQELLLRQQDISRFSLLILSLYIIISLISFGGLLDHAEWAPFLECARCVMYVAADTYLARGNIDRTMFLHILQFTYIFSACLAALQCFRQVTKKISQKGDKIN